jgi:hypothetical protein
VQTLPFILLQGTPPATPVDVPFAGSTLFWVLMLVLAAVLAALAFIVGKFWGRLRAGKEFAADRDRMFTIEKSLQEFFESDRKKLEAEKNDLSQRLELAEKKSEEYKRKAAGVGVMGMGKDRKAELLLEMMVENEALEEKLFEQNVKLKNERDEHLARELQHVSVKRVLLSEILKEERVRDTIRDVLADDGKLRKVSLDTKPVPAETIVQGTAEVIDSKPTGPDPEAAPSDEATPEAAKADASDEATPEAAKADAETAPSPEGSEAPSA